MKTTPSKKGKKVKFPKKAKLISDGGLYRIVDVKEPVSTIEFPIMRRIRINQPDLDYVENLLFLLVFSFDKIYKGYAEYRQTNQIKMGDIPLPKKKLNK